MGAVVANAGKAGARAPPCRRGLHRQGPGQAGLAAPPVGRAMKAQEVGAAAVLVAAAAVVAQVNPIP
jgi:hypothetical protein